MEDEETATEMHMMLAVFIPLRIKTSMKVLLPQAPVYRLSMLLNTIGLDDRSTGTDEQSYLLLKQVLVKLTPLITSF